MVRSRAAAFAATVLAFASAAISLYWLLGGNTGLRSVGGSVERMARARSALALAALAAVVVAKCVAGAVAVRLARLTPAPWQLRRLAVVGGTLLALYGHVLVVAGALALSGVVDATGADRYALRWHVGLWDLWFAIWGLALAVAGRLARRPG